MSSYYVEARQQLYPQKGKKSAQKAKLSRSWSKYKVANSAVPLIDKYQYKATYVWNTHFDNAKWNNKHDLKMNQSIFAKNFILP